MSVKKINIEGKDLPIKWSMRARSNWEEATGIKWLDLPGKKDVKGEWIKHPHTFSTKDTAIMCLEILREGHRQDKKAFNLDIYNIMEWMDSHDLEAKIVDQVFAAEVEKEKKSTPSV